MTEHRFRALANLSAAIDAVHDADLRAEERAFRDLSARLQARINRLTYGPQIGRTHTARLAANATEDGW